MYILKKSVFCCFLLMSLAGCQAFDRSVPSKSYPTRSQPVLTPAPKSVNQQVLNSPTVKVALLLPLSGKNMALGQAMGHAAELAVFDHAGPEFELIIKNTGGTPTSAAQAASEAIREGARLILGPVFGSEVLPVSLIANPTNIHVISFSTDSSAVTKGVHIIGNLPSLQVNRILTYAYSQGLRNFAVVAPAGPYGRLIVETAKNTLANLKLIPVNQILYDPQNRDLMPVINQLKSDPTKSIDALLLAEEGQKLRSLAFLANSHELDSKKIRYLGTSLWANENIGREQSLEGGWYAAPPTEQWDQFQVRYRQLYKNDPPRLTALAYDMVAMAALLSKKNMNDPFALPTLTQRNGFEGIDGIFRLTPNGLVERGLAIFEVQSGQIVIRDPAPQSLDPLIN
ncbi:MAG: penicillin-binding protein activator [Alphaproteobacteria bacterium]|nr:penicillin-binding protein activator [Alphaproteobacteria bacterium]